METREDEGAWITDEMKRDSAYLAAFAAFTIDESDFFVCKQSDYITGWVIDTTDGISSGSLGELSEHEIRIDEEHKGRSG